MKLKKRNELNKNLTWDLTRLFKTETDYNKELKDFLLKSESFIETFKGKLNNVSTIINMFKAYESLIKKSTYLSTYASLHVSVDQQNEKHVLRHGLLLNKLNDFNSKITFIDKELFALNKELLIKAKNEDNNFAKYIDNIIKYKQHRLSEEVEQVLTDLSPVLSAPYSNYGRFKFADMTFDNFNVNGEDYELSFAKFENEYQSDLRTKVRHEAHRSFYNKLKQYENGFANNYQTQVIKEHKLAKLRGFDSTIDYLLFNQDVTRDMYDRQIDLITKHLKEPMRKYAKLIKEAHNLNVMTYADLKLPLDPTYEPHVTIKEASELNLEALSVLGDDYTKLVSKALKERWIDFPQNIGKSTGGFCSSPYQKGSFILLNWNNQMDEAFVLAHELGHAGHFHFASENQSLFNTRSSMYFIEAPSTMNELILARHFLNKKSDNRFKRWVYSTLISRTYYHNFVTHLLEAAYQREVYLMVDKGIPLSGKTLTSTKAKVLRDFWGDDVVINDEDGLTWMRQPHYFMGLYPYTYSAGLTISTAVEDKINKGTLKYSDWINVLKMGGSKSPLELAKLVDVDLSTKKPLMTTIKYISTIIDNLETLTNDIKLEDK